jgi:hypothetical protein
MPEHARQGETRMKRATILALGLLLIPAALTCVPASAQSGRDRGRVCVYEHAGFGGWERCYGIGESVPDLGKLRNGISSVRVEGRAEITIYEHPNFQGRSQVIGADLGNFDRLHRWNDQADSLRVTASGFPEVGNRRRDDVVCVYQHANFQGNSHCFRRGEQIGDLNKLGWNDGISSIRAFGDARIAFYEHAGFQGERLVAEGDMPDLTRVRLYDRYNWNDRISSLRVAGSGRRGSDANRRD